MQVEELKANEQLLKELKKLKKKFQDKKEKEKEKQSKKYIVFKGEEFHTKEELFDFYSADGCTSAELEKAEKKLDKQLGQNWTGKTQIDYTLDILSNFISDVLNEIKQGEFENLPMEEQTKILEERLK